MELRKLGKTNEHLSAFCLGGWHSSAAEDENDSIRLMHAAMDAGVNFFDNAWDYHDGVAETRMGKALAMDGRRKKVFLMTKNCERDGAGSMRNLEESLSRLQTDYLDLWMFHECNYDNDPEWIFSRGGIEAAIRAREQGKVRFIGFTGHKDPRIHLDMLSRPFDWDASLMPINVMDAHYRSFARHVVPVCREKGVGVLGMKGLGGGYPTGAILDRTDLTAAECYRYALSQDVDAQVMGITNLGQLSQALAIVDPFTRMTGAEQDALRARVREEASDGRHETFKSTSNHDGPHHRKQHGFALA